LRGSGSGPDWRRPVRRGRRDACTQRGWLLAARWRRSVLARARVVPAWTTARLPGREGVVADLVDHLVQPVHRLAETFTGRLRRQVRRGLQAEPDLEQVLDHPVEQLPGRLGLADCDAPSQVREI